MNAVRRLLLLTPMTLFAGETTIDINLISRHLGSTEELNEVNPGVGMSWAYNDGGRGHWLTTIGEYKNSFSDTSVYAGAGYMCRFGGQTYVDVGVVVPVVTGYEKGLVIGPTPVLSLGRVGSGRVNLVYAADARREYNGVVMLSVSIEL